MSAFVRSDAGVAGYAAAVPEALRSEIPSMLYLSHESALQFYRSDKGRHWGKKGEKRPFGKGDVIAADDATLEKLLSSYGLELPLHVVVGDERCRRNSKALHCHILSCEVGEPAFIAVEDTVAVSSPELMLLQLSKRLSVVELAVLASELLSRFALAPSNEKGFALYRGSLLDVAKCMELIESAVRVKGRRRLAKALRYAVSNARSPMEVILTLLLCLPLRMGGYGLKKPVLNPKIDVLSRDRFSKSGSFKDDRYGDLVWQKEKLIVEYDSKANHDDVKRDVDRCNQLVANGWKVITVLPEHVFNRDRCNQIASEISAALKAKSRELPEGYQDLQTQLRSDLFTACGTQCEENRNWVPPEESSQSENLPPEARLCRFTNGALESCHS